MQSCLKSAPTHTRFEKVILFWGWQLCPLRKTAKPAPPQIQSAWELEKARRLGAVRHAAFLLPPTLAQLFVKCFVSSAILLVARVCLFRSIRGLYNFASPGDLIPVVIGVIVPVQS